MSGSRLTLPRVDGDLGEALAKIRDALSVQLLGEKTERPFTFSVENDDGSYGAPAWSDVSGGVYVSDDTIEALAEPDIDAVFAIAHQLVHAIGSGPAFVRLEEQLLEEAIAETLTQCYGGAFYGAFGGASAVVASLFRALPKVNDLEVRRPTAANVSVERFGRLAAWLEGLEGDADDDELEAAALMWSAKLKQMPGGDRFPVLAATAAKLGQGDAGDDVGATEVLEEYLRGYMRQLRRSETGFAGLDYALARAWKDDVERPQANAVASTDGWRENLSSIEAVTLTPLPKEGAIAKALTTAADPEVAAAVQRSLDARALLWSARQVDASLVSAQK